MTFLKSIKDRLTQVEQDVAKNKDLIDKLSEENLDMDTQTSEHCTALDKSIEDLTSQVKDLTRTCTDMFNQINTLTSRWEETNRKLTNLTEDLARTKRIVVYKRKKVQDQILSE